MTTLSLLPVSFSQELLWLIDRAAPGSSAYNVPRTRRLLGALDVPRLQRSFDALAQRHEILRTTYAFNAEQPVQIVHEPGAVPLAYVDLAGLDEAQRRAAAERQVRAWTAAAFDLSREAPLRVGVIRLAADEHVLHVDTHHIASDGGSRDILLRELDAFYAADAAGVMAELPPLAVQYADYAIWEREHFSGERLEGLLQYWRAELDGADYVLNLPADFPRPSLPSDEAVTRSLLLPPALSEAVAALGRRYDATPYMTLLAAYQSVLQRYAGQPDVLVGSPVAGRTQPETEGLIGYFARTVVQRARFARDPTFGELLAQVRRSCLGAYDHRDVPFEKLVLELQAGLQPGRSPLFQAVFTMLEQVDSAAGGLGDLELLPFGNELASTKFDLTLFMAERPQGLYLSARARAELWAPATLERFLGHLQTLLEAAVVDPQCRVSALPLLTSAEERELSEWNGGGVIADGSATGLANGVSSLHGAIEATAARVPGRTAVVADDGEATFAELEMRANALVERLRGRGVTPGARVGLLFDRSKHAIVALLAVLKAGAAYVPLSIEGPPARLAAQAEQAGIRLVLSLAASAVELPGIEMLCLDERESAAVSDGGGIDHARAGQVEADPGQRGESEADFGRFGEEAAPARFDASEAALANGTAEDLAYVLFTSGSTGVPKGVAVTHANALHYTAAIAKVLGGAAQLDGLHFATAGTLAADLGNTAIFPALCCGGTLHLLSSEIAKDGERFAAYLRTRPIDVLKLTPAHFGALATSEEDVGAIAPLPRRWLILGGEALSLELAGRIVRARGCRLLNHYGPTETTVGACTFEVTPESLATARALGAQTVPVGLPLDGVTCDVLDARGALVPLGVPGELFIGGAGVARGYVGGAGDRADAGSHVFVESPGAGRRYRTGDRVRRLPGGALEFLGRLDGQVKIRGHRVEVGELESALAAFPGVTQAAARPWSADGDMVLAAYVVVAAAATADGDLPARLRLFLAGRVPEYMLPRSVAFLEALPLGPSGKVDRAALPPPDDAPRPALPVAPRTAAEAALVEIWAEAMRRDAASFGVHDSFLALGGHSLLAIRILGAIKRRFSVRLALRALFDAPTVAELAAVIEREQAADAPAEPSLVRVPRAVYRRPPSNGNGRPAS